VGGAFDSDGEIICCASTKEGVIKKVIRIARQGEEKIKFEKSKWLGNKSRDREFERQQKLIPIEEG
jgi:hypothetical protein